MSIFINTPILSILDPFISLMGIIINYIYKALLLVGVEKVAICIVVFTVVIKILLLPLTYKQQKFTKVSAKMNPEIQAIAEKYKGKKDQESMLKMQQEQREVYNKYGSSPMSGCLPMIVIMILLFALYPVVYSIPIYVEDIGDKYREIITDIEKDEDAGVIPKYISVNEAGEVVANDSDDVDQTYTIEDAIYAFYVSNGVYVRKAPSYKLGKTEYSTDNLVAIMAGFSKDDWNEFFAGVEITDEDVIKNVSNKKGDAEAWNLYAPYIAESLSGTYTDSDGNEVDSSKVKNNIVDINTIFGINIFDKPSFRGITILIPILAALLQLLQSKLTLALNETGDDEKKKKKKQTEPNPMDSMKTMTYMMPIFSGFICFSLPIGIGLYWITSSLMSIILQIIINEKLKNTDITEFIEESQEKKKKQYEKYGVHNDQGGAVSDVAKTTTKSIGSLASYSSSEEKKDKGGKKDQNKSKNRKDAVIPEEKRHYKTSSIADIANIYKEDDEEPEDNRDTQETGEEK